MPSRIQDPPEKISFMDGHWATLAGGHGVAEASEQATYLAIGLRDVQADNRADVR